ncbi:MAG: class I SAM-dependent rRNA methyltransferase [Deferribacterales bacterium]
MKTSILKKQKHKLAANRNPWVFSGSVYGFDTIPENGEAVRVEDYDRNFIAYGFFSSESAITLRLFSWDENEDFDGVFERRIEDSLNARKVFIGENTDSYRLMFSESDFLPGYVADFYAGHISLQVNTASAVKYLPQMKNALIKTLNPLSIYVRPADELLKKEKIRFPEHCLHGETPESIIIKENGLKISASPMSGQKTGYYFDQRENRLAVAEYAGGKSVLDCFCYTGGFSMNCAVKGANHIISADSSADALNNLKTNFALNNLTEPETVKADIFEYLRHRQNDTQEHGIVILDPPKLAKSQQDVDSALRAYKDLNMLGMKKVEKNGILASFSCSGRVKREDFIKSVSWAAKDAGKNIRIIENLSQAKDHPVSPFFPESEYLKGIIAIIS